MKAAVVPNVKRRSLHPEIRENAEAEEAGSTVYSDALKSYEGLDPHYVHKVIDHAEAYVKGHVHTNGIENFWSLLKRGLKGTTEAYVSVVEPFHLFRYIDEQAFRFNARKEAPETRFSDALLGVTGRRLTYKQLTGEAGS